MVTGTEIAGLFAQSELPTSKYDTYFPIYEDLFGRFRGRKVTFVEVGILGGGSLQAWRRYFGAESRIIGVDLNPALKPILESKGFEIHIGDLADPQFWKDFFAKVGQIDLLLDDGGHSNLQTWTTLVQALPHVRDGGVIAIEDTHASYLREFGNPGPRSFVTRAKAVVDQLNLRSSRISRQERDKFGRPALFDAMDPRASVFSIRFYESVVGFLVDRRLSRQSRQVTFGDPSALPSAQVPEDYRHKGVEEADLAVSRSIWSRVFRRLKSFLWSRFGQ